MLAPTVLSLLNPALLEATSTYPLLLEYVPTLPSVGRSYYSWFPPFSSIFPGSSHRLQFRQFRSPLGLRSLQLFSALDWQYTIQTTCTSPAQITLDIIMFSVLPRNLLHQNMCVFICRLLRPTLRIWQGQAFPLISLLNTFWQTLS